MLWCEAVPHPPPAPCPKDLDTRKQRLGSRRSQRVPCILLAFLAAMLLTGMGSSPIRRDELVEFYPTVGYRSGDGWTLPIHGVIYKPKDDSHLRAATIAFFRRLFGLKEGEGDEVFTKRAKSFVVDNQRGKAISVRLGTKDYPVAPSGANGHFRGTIRLRREEVAALFRAPGAETGWITFQAATLPGDDRIFSGRVNLLAGARLSVISDVDDTVKMSQVRDRRELLANTFLREFRPVPGMAEAYRKWAADGAAFHYVSASPWQLYDPLARFLAAEGFPEGSFHLKLFRVKDSSFFDLYTSPEAYKRRTIEPILKAFPGRRFVLVGDSGEKDPEAYGAIARDHPDQIVRIIIRDVTGEPADGERYQTAFRSVKTDRWMVFREASEIQNVTFP